MQVIWTDPALERVDEIAVYIAQDDPDAAARWTVELFDAVARIESWTARYNHPWSRRQPGSVRAQGGETLPTYLVCDALRVLIGSLLRFRGLRAA